MSKSLNQSFSFMYRDKIFLLIVILVYLFLSFILFSHYLHIFNDDGISYLTIASEYTNGNFSDAINGYWSPLFSWLMVPFLFLSDSVLGDLFVVRALSVLIGLFTLFGVYFLISNMDLGKKIKIITLFTMVPIILSFVFNLLTPDLLLCCFLVYYMAFLIHPDYSSKLKWGILSGFMGAFAFLSKSYAFVFFPIHFVLTNLYYLKSYPVNRKKICKNLILGLLIFFIIAGAWSSVISSKYEKLTFSTAGSYNYDLFGPNSSGNPILNMELVKPPNDQAVSAWEDPSYFPTDNWSPFESFSSFIHLLGIFFENVKHLYGGILLEFSIFSWIIIVLGIYLAFKTRDQITRDKFVILTSTILIYPLAYCFIYVSERYCWLIYILIVVLGLYSLKTLFEMKLIQKNVYKILIILLTFSFIINPLIYLNDGFNGAEGYYLLSYSLKDVGVSGNVASNDKYVISDKLCYYLNCKYYGETHLSGSALNGELLKNNIDYYLSWNGEDINLSDYKELENFNNKYLRIYKRIG